MSYEEDERQLELPFNKEENPEGKKTGEDEEPGWVWECAGCGKRAGRFTEILVRRRVDNEHPPNGR